MEICSNSLWLMRILHTKNLVHVRADLTVDGEPLVMERTFRCYDPVDYKFMRIFSFGKFNSKFYWNDGQVGDSVTGTTSKGRRFMIAIPDSCKLNNQRIKAGLDSLSLRNNDFMTPRVIELRGHQAENGIDVYMPRELLLQGFRGIKIEDIHIGPSPLNPDKFYKDWEDIEWLGSIYWGRPRPGMNNFEAVFLLKISYDDLTHFRFLQEKRQTGYNAEDIAKLLDLFRRLEQEKSDRLFGLNYLKHEDYPDSYLSRTMFTRETIGFIPPFYPLAYSTSLNSPRVMSELERPYIAAYSWDEQHIVPCTFTAAPIVITCNEGELGVARFQRWKKGMLDRYYRPLIIGPSQYEVYPGDSFAFRASDKSIFLIEVQ